MTTSFRDTLLGKPSHDALIKLQDYEIKLMEIIRKTISARIKCEKEYAQSLNQLSLISSRIDPPNFQSTVYDAWKEIVNELTQTSQSIKKNVDALQNSTFDKLLNLIKNKTTIKKTYIENRDRIDNQLLKVMHSDLDKKRNIYAKTEAETTNNRQTHEQLISKKNSRLITIERAQDKYRKSTMKLHNYHNDYVLQVEEAKMHQKQYRSSLLPELLNGLQYMENQYVDVLKEVLTEYLFYTSPCREEFVSAHKNAEEKSFQIDSSVEYQDFIDLRRSDLEVEANINFEPLQNEGASLPPGHILLDRLSLQGIENLINGYQDDLEVIQAQIDDRNLHLNQLDEEIRQFMQNKESLSLLLKQHEFVSTKLELIEQENLHLRQQQLCYLLTQSIQNLGDREPPPGLVLPEIDLSLVEKSSKPTGFITILTEKVTGNKKTSVDKSIPSVFDSSKDIREQSWYHGAIPRVEATRLLQEEGSFLLREGKQNPGDNAPQLVLSALSDGQPRHFKMQRNELGLYKFESEAFDSIFKLIHHHYKNNIPIKKNPKCVLLTPVCKDKWQLPHSAIEIGDKLGAGNFGNVYRGYMQSTGQFVAVKTCKETVDARTRDKFLMEAKIMKGYDHPNVVKLIGVCTDKHPIYIVLELVPGGDLGDYVRIQKALLQQRHLVMLCKDACAGLSYLEEKKCIHRDVAARNCLVSEEGVVKITDFGMSREEDDGIYTVSGTMKSIPMRWTAPEAMDYGKFTSASDVWSFGILSWEVFSFGERPYPGMTNIQTREKVAVGYRMPQQPTCPDRYYTDVMKPCWNDDPDKRPHFSTLCRIIESILRSL